MPIDPTLGRRATLASGTKGRAPRPMRAQDLAAGAGNPVGQLKFLDKLSVCSMFVLMSSSLCLSLKSARVDKHSA